LRSSSDIFCIGGGKGGLIDGACKVRNADPQWQKRHQTPDGSISNDIAADDAPLRLDSTKNKGKLPKFEMLIKSSLQSPRTMYKGAGKFPDTYVTQF